ncbi:MAG: hypothetical protein L0271_09690, partial [Gemmatimonadetes bacterium]|nr:hypothetical protein [Gemmatimonadota bacterium]
KVVARHWFQHVVHDVFHVSVLMNAFQFVQGRAHTWHCGAHTVVNSQEHGFISGLAVARQLGAGYPFEDAAARAWFNFWGRGLFGRSFRAVREGERAPAHPPSESPGSTASAGAAAG